MQLWSNGRLLKVLQFSINKPLMQTKVWQPLLGSTLYLTFVATPMDFTVFIYGRGDCIRTHKLVFH